MVSFNEMHGFYYKFQAALSAAVNYCITAYQTLSFLFIVAGGSVSVDFIFQEKLGSKEKSFYLLFF
jgi:hypothetical protein